MPEIGGRADKLCWGSSCHAEESAAAALAHSMHWHLLGTAQPGAEDLQDDESAFPCMPQEPAGMRPAACLLVITANVNSGNDGNDCMANPLLLSVRARAAHNHQHNQLICAAAPLTPGAYAYIVTSMRSMPSYLC